MLAALLMAASTAVASPRLDSATVYRTVLMRAAPGRLLELIDLVMARLPALDAAGEERPLILRHSQGDQWDLLLLYPVGSLAGYYSTARQARRNDGEFEQRLQPLVAWREEEFVTGPPLAELRERDRGAGFYHIEMFVSLAGRQADLVRERQMENDFLAGTGRAGNLIFTRVAGASWDSFTIGFYRNIQQYAESPAMSPAAQDSVARAVGFQDRAHIGPYLRELIASHHDTLAGRVHP